MTTTASDALHTSDDHSTAKAGPSPTESVGCVAHGDHWHCDGPASTSAAESGVAGNSTASASSTSLSPVVTGNSAGVEGAKLGFAAVLAGIVGAMAL
jgi:hypothetical protein